MFGSSHSRQQANCAPPSAKSPYTLDSTGNINTQGVVNIGSTFCRKLNERTLHHVQGLQKDKLFGLKMAALNLVMKS